MSDNRNLGSDKDLLPTSDQKNDASDVLRSSLTVSDFLSAKPASSAAEPKYSDKTLEAIAEYKVGRYALVTAEGLSLLPQGVLNGVKHNWDNPGEFGLKMGMAAAFGVGMRVLLPKAGAARALAGSLMSYFMVRDVAAPMVGAFNAVSENKDMNTIHGAAKMMADGWGLFAVDMAAGMPVGIGAERLTGRALGLTSTGRNFDLWKEDFYNSDKYAAGRFFNWSARTADATTDAIAARLARRGHAEDGPSLTIDQKLAAIQRDLKHHHAAPGDVNPRMANALEAYLQHKRQHNRMPERIDTLLGDKAAVAEGRVVAPTAEATTAGTSSVRRLMAGEDALNPSAKPAGKPTDLTPVPTDKPVVAATTGPKVNDADTVGQMAVTVREQAGKTDSQQMKVDNFRESVESPLTQAMRDGKPPLDEGHFANNKSLLELAAQVQTPEHVQQAGFLLEHFRVANSQLGIPKQLPEIVDLNQYSRSVHNNLMNLLRQNGIKPEEVLRGTNSPIFLIFDSNGAGPYTIPAIKGVTDTAVIVLPREYRSMLGVHVAGVYPHELGHDLIFGDLLRFPQNLRDHILKQDVVAKAMADRGIADVPVQVPGHGTMKKSELFTELLRAQANENTADMFGTSIDPNTGLSLAVLLGSLRKPAAGKTGPGQLETRSMYGKEFVEDGNPLGIEVHGVDAWRIKLTAETLRQLANNDAKVVAHAATLDQLANAMRRPGDNYVWANMDQQGSFISVPIKEWDAIIPCMVKAQLDTPLPALNGKTLKQVYPDASKTFPRVDALADSMAAAARANEVSIPKFDKPRHAPEDIMSAGLSAWMKAIAANPEKGQPGYVAPEVLLARINKVSEGLRSLYREDNFLPPAGPGQPVSLSGVLGGTVNFMSRSVGDVVGAQPKLRHKFEQWAPRTGNYTGVALTGDLFDRMREQEAKKAAEALP
ncbi:MAG: hypothetical protein K2W95_12775 [Candidatus Obscuribacterales bacterium]|nr:hypothetical protein [Candidatus Obscuribacterales bacterium]